MIYIKDGGHVLEASCKATDSLSKSTFYICMIPVLRLSFRCFIKTADFVFRKQKCPLRLVQGCSFPFNVY